ncbi:MAG: copper resistance protein CopC/CopD [Actinobacteria bacterium]|nr:copper resistance protein CopC/CopD [Actinomycetota bacterium]
MGWVAVAALTVGVLVGYAPPARAHAALVSSQPGPGARLTSAPGVVEVGFSEPIIVELSSLIVTDPGGDTWSRTVARDHSMLAAVDTNLPGVYLVSWKTVSPIDGHTLRGTFRFGVGVTPDQAAADATVAPRAPDLLIALGRAIEYAGLLTAVGLLLVSRLARREPALTWVRAQPAGALGVALIAGVAVVVGEALLAAASPSVAAVARYLFAEPGIPRLVRVGATTVAVCAERSPARRRLTWVSIMVAIVALSASGHAAAARPAWWGVTVDGLHVLAAGLWAGGILALALAARPPGGWRGRDARQLLRRFSRPALWAFVATVAFGTVRGAQELVGVQDLIATSYGQVLTVKILAVALMLPMSLVAWRRRTARPRREAGLAVVVIGAAALLAAYPVPPQRAAEDADVDEAAPGQALPRTDDLTLGGRTGDILVGLTLRPGTPGRNDVLVHLVPPGGEEAAGALTADLLVGDRTVALESCGPMCRRVSTVVHSEDVLRVQVDGVTDDPARFALPALPAADGRALLDRVDERMAQVNTLRYDEVLGPADPAILSTAEIVAPDRIDFTVVSRDRETIRIGSTFYRRAGDGPWEVEEGPPVTVPSYIWEYPNKIAPRIVGRERLDDVSTRVLSFFVDDISGQIWYRLWVDADGLVHRAEMRTRGHFMDHDYYDFDAAVSVEPPTDVIDGG